MMNARTSNSGPQQPNNHDGDGHTEDRRRAFPAPWHGSRIRNLAIAVLGVAAFAAVSLLPWEWSFVDDGQLLQMNRDGREAGGPVLGLADAFGRHMRFDAEWGLFRPAFWFYATLFYLLPVGPAHAVRVAMLVPAFVGPLVYAWRRAPHDQRRDLLAWGCLLLFANTSILSGIWFPSLQELSALCFVGLGLLDSRRRWVRVVCWLIAAWFKAPFAWLLVAYGTLLWTRRERRRLGLVTAGFGVATLATAAAVARSGSYTAQLSFTPERIRATMLSAIFAFGPVLLVLVAGAIGLGARAPGRIGTVPLALMLGGAGYLANLLPWIWHGYYASAYVYLVAVGGYLAMCETRAMPWRRVVAALAVPAILTAAMVVVAARDGWHIHANTTALRDCVMRLPAHSVIGYNRAESWIRLEQIVQRHRPAWPGRMAQVLPGEAVGRRFGERLVLDYAIEERGQPPGARALRTGPVVCRTGSATVYQVVG